MLSPIDVTVLRNNPKFASLYGNLASNILNPNGSTKGQPAQKEREKISESYRQARKQSLKSEILVNSIRDLDLTACAPTTSSSSSSSKSKPPPPLPLELVELILLLTSLLTSSTPVPQSTIELLQSTPTFTSLPTHLPQLSALISNHLQTSALAFSRIAFSSTNPSYLHRQIGSLPAHVQTLRNAVETQKSDLQTQRLALVSLTIRLLSEYHNVSVRTIEILEQRKYGSIARHAKAKGEWLSMRAQEVDVKCKEKLGRGEVMLYTDVVRDALGNYKQELRSARERLGERAREARRVLWGYGVGRDTEEDDGGKGMEKARRMKEIARVYGELLAEADGVRRDIETLKGK